MPIFVERLSRFMALIGGLVLTVLILLTCISVLGRGINTLAHAEWLIWISKPLSEFLIATGVGPLNGDFELVEAGIAFSIFAFLPYTQLHKGHAVVDILTSMMSPRVQQFIISFWEIVLSAVILLISWRLFEGMMGKLNTGQTTLLLAFPTWWAYGASFIASLVAAIVSLYCACTSLITIVTGRPSRHDVEGETL